MLEWLQQLGAALGLDPAALTDEATAQQAITDAIKETPEGRTIMVELGQDTIVPAGVSVRPTADLTHDDAQLLMDGLWDCGLRPVGAAGSAGQLEAVDRHLQDMRRIVFSPPPSFITDLKP